MSARKRKRKKTNKNKRWIAQVKTVSTFPPPGLFTKDASTIAKSLASKKVSPKGPQSGMRMLNYFINRAGRGLSASRRAELERAKLLLSKRIREKTNPAASAPPSDRALVQQSFRMHQFGIQQRRSGRSANRIVSKQHEFVSQHGAFPQPANLHCHATEALNV
jgi:hypothetical protein